MWHLRRLGADFQTLELTAQRAGSAWACPFASSAEFEAANIQAKRAAGVYGPKRRRRQLLLAGAMIALLVFCLIQLF
jgi:hypothetical protein